MAAAASKARGVGTGMAVLYNQWADEIDKGVASAQRVHESLVHERQLEAVRNWKKKTKDSFFNGSRDTQIVDSIEDTLIDEEDEEYA